MDKLAYEEAIRKSHNFTYCDKKNSQQNAMAKQDNGDIIKWCDYKNVGYSNLLDKDRNYWAGNDLRQKNLKGNFEVKSQQKPLEKTNNKEKSIEKVMRTSKNQKDFRGSGNIISWT